MTKNLSCQSSVTIRIASPHGFCAGVERAIAIVDNVLENFPAPVYVRHEVVHNRFVVDNLKAKGAIFVEEIDEVPDGAVTIFSAHGVSKEVREQAIIKNLKVFDATCPLVTKVHIEVGKLASKGRKVIMIGHSGHPEVQGTMGQLLENKITLIESVDDVAKLDNNADENIGYVTQTTLSQDDTKEIIAKLQERFVNVEAPKKSDICYATQNRQDAVKAIAPKCDLILIIGSKNSSNSNRLREVAQKSGTIAYLIDSAEDLLISWLYNKKNIGISAGASAPEVLVQEVIIFLKNHFNKNNINVELVNENVVVEDVKFPLPIELIKK